MLHYSRNSVGVASIPSSAPSSILGEIDSHSLPFSFDHRLRQFIERHFQLVIRLSQETELGDFTLENRLTASGPQLKQNATGQLDSGVGLHGSRHEWSLQRGAILANEAAAGLTGSMTRPRRSASAAPGSRLCAPVERFGR